MKIALILMTIFSTAVFAGAQYKVKVNIIVLKDSANRGNNKWVNRSYVLGFLQEASKIDKIADFQLKSLSVKRDSTLYRSLSQMPALRLAHSKSKKKEITVVITNERTNKTAGLAYISTNYRPSMAMRSRHNGSNQYSSTAKKADAAIFLHELGHNMNLKHSGKIHTDNYTKTSAGQSFEKKYYAKLTGQKLSNRSTNNSSRNNRLYKPRLGFRKYEP